MICGELRCGTLKEEEEKESEEEEKEEGGNHIRDVENTHLLHIPQLAQIGVFTVEAIFHLFKK